MNAYLEKAVETLDYALEDPNRPDELWEVGISAPGDFVPQFFIADVVSINSIKTFHGNPYQSIRIKLYDPQDFYASFPKFIVFRANYTNFISKRVWVEGLDTYISAGWASFDDSSLMDEGKHL